MVSIPGNGIHSRNESVVSSLRLGVIGMGNMGSAHAIMVRDGHISDCTLSAICDTHADNFKRFPGVEGYAKSDDLIASGLVDAVLIATPHYSHTTVGIQALQAGLHVLVEKPISAHKADCDRLLSAHVSPNQVFAAMFNQRTDPFYRKLKSLIDTGELGEIRRINWTITNWFRTEAYYSSGGWRATWAGEGGGVLLNQCPHQLDLWQWLFGMPQKVRAFCKIGRYHDIEVEDDVTAYLEYENGTTGVFITSTGEAPGTNRLEVAAERGRVTIENDQFSFVRNETPMSEFSRTSPSKFGAPSVWNINIPIGGHGGQHKEILQNFVDAVRKGTPLIAPACEGIHSVELANAMALSSFQDDTLDLPLDAGIYEGVLKKKVAASTIVKKETFSEVNPDDFSKSFRS